MGKTCCPFCATAYILKNTQEHFRSMWCMMAQDEASRRANSEAQTPCAVVSLAPGRSTRRGSLGQENVPLQRTYVHIRQICPVPQLEFNDFPLKSHLPHLVVCTPWHDHSPRGSDIIVPVWHFKLHISYVFFDFIIIKMNNCWNTWTHLLPWVLCN